MPYFLLDMSYALIFIEFMAHARSIIINADKYATTTKLRVLLGFSQLMKQKQQATMTISRPGTNITPSRTWYTPPHPHTPPRSKLPPPQLHQPNSQPPSSQQNHHPEDPPKPSRQPSHPPPQVQQQEQQQQAQPPPPEP